VRQPLDAADDVVVQLQLGKPLEAQQVVDAVDVGEAQRQRLCCLFGCGNGFGEGGL
jgi:hypothetical protein